MMIKLRITDDIFASYPETLIGIVVAKGIENTGEKPEVIAGLRKEEEKIRQQFSNASINDHPHIVPWREAYRKFGAKPKDYPSSVENIVKRVNKGHTIPHINTLVDVYNVISLRYIVPVGGEDLDAARGDIVLTFAGNEEPAVRLLGEKEERSPRAGEVIYKDDIGAICRRWNWKEAERTKLTENTVNAVLVIEGLPPVDRNIIEQAIQELAGLVRQHCGGEVTTKILDASQRATTLVSN